MPEPAGQTPRKARPFTRDWLVSPWRRLAVLLACFAWLVAEAIWGSTVWTIIAVALLAVGAWEFFFSGKYDPPEAQDSAPATSDDPDAGRS